MEHQSAPQPEAAAPAQQGDPTGTAATPQQDTARGLLPAPATEEATTIVTETANVVPTPRKELTPYSVVVLADLREATTSNAYGWIGIAEADMEALPETAPAVPHFVIFVIPSAECVVGYGAVLGAPEDVSELKDSTRRELPRSWKRVARVAWVRVGELPFREVAPGVLYQLRASIDAAAAAGSVAALPTPAGEALCDKLENAAMRRLPHEIRRMAVNLTRRPRGPPMPTPMAMPQQALLQTAPMGVEVPPHSGNAVHHYPAYLAQTQQLMHAQQFMHAQQHPHPAHFPQAGFDGAMLPGVVQPEAAQGAMAGAPTAPTEAVEPAQPDDGW